MTAPASVDGATLDQWFKDIYQQGYTSLLPNNTKLYRMVKFNQRDLMGEKVAAGVITQRSNGFTYGGTQNTAFDLITPKPMQTRRAEVSPNQIVLREYISLATATRGASSAQAFGETVGLVVENMMESFGNRLEISLLYGGVELAQFLSKTNPTGSTIKYVVDSQEWAVGLWAGMEGSVYNFYNGSTLLGSTDPLSANAIGTLTEVDVDSKTVTFEFDATGYTAVNAVAATSVRPYFAGSYNNDMAGLHKICNNAGTLFNISAVDYSLWRSAQYTITGALTVGKVNRLIAKLVGKGLSEDAELFVNPDTWTDMIQDVLAQRLFDSSYSEGRAVLGSKTLAFVSQSGRIDIYPHNMVKQGYAYLGPVGNRMERCGSTDITMRHPGYQDEKIFLNLPNNNGFELRAFSDQSLFTKKPGLFGIVSGIENGA